ncbi:hypothetical protein [Tautonia plasticadhaerens]|uniref:PEP-CTERM protein-sorting domain-containing protein n=1 Tax=Tautonia plasticadhaerens TaxID=2527974 RepID=A0A518GXS6_9BACT|nr:hypothetical protein [Tautonia plasticadhaerens]QDV33385.1 hypothetical protein ElP_12560 [Tautonia plasticadhaerens]
MSIRFDPGIPTANGGSVTSSFVGNDGTYNVFEQGAVAEIRDGVDPNGASHDIQFTFGTAYLVDELWFDPDPSSRTDPVPSNRTDAVSVLLHEFGHALGFNGRRDLFDGSLPGNYQSTRDALTTFDGSDFFFVGALAMDLYGGPVPLTYGNIFHLGNPAPRPGDDLIGDLMNGVVYYRGTRYGISDLDLAILSDIGVPISFSSAIPEPSTFTACLIGGMVIGLSRGVGRRARSVADMRPGSA